LDRDELEHLIEAGGAHYVAGVLRAAAGEGDRPKSRKRSLLEGLLEGGE
jgi:hypothetical protein